MLAILPVLALIWGCSKAPPVSPPASMPPLAPPTSSIGSTFGSMAESGNTVFTSRCAQCHGDSGQGIKAPAVIGSGASLGKYSTAKGLFDFISTAMPPTKPGSLSNQDYLNVLSYLLVQNSYAFPATAFDENALVDLKL